MGKNDPPPPRPPQQGQQQKTPPAPGQPTLNDNAPIIPSITPTSNSNTDTIMGGSGNGGTVAGGGGRRQDACEDLVILTTIQGVIKAAMDRVAEADRLTVTLDGGKVIVLNNDGDICGTITNGNAKLVECLNKGVDFVAVVTKKDKAECQVRVQSGR